MKQRVAELGTLLAQPFDVASTVNIAPSGNLFERNRITQSRPVHLAAVAHYFLNHPYEASVLVCNAADPISILLTANTSRAASVEGTDDRLFQ